MAAFDPQLPLTLDHKTDFGVKDANAWENGVWLCGSWRV